MEVEACRELRCPNCLAALHLEPFLREQDAGGDFVRQGALLCEGCRVLYPIESYTPVMLRFGTRFHDWFVGAHESDLRPFSEYSLASGEARPGERVIQETFTEEWDLTRDAELAGYFTQEQLEAMHRNCCLRWLEDLPESDRPETVMNVGCGAGMETIALQAITRAPRVFGVDLNFALLSRRAGFRRQKGINFVIASLFDLPFKRESFDLVYSVGVLHHTYSTPDAFRAISTRVAPDGHLFVWVYGLDDHLTAWGRRWRALFMVERIARPWISRAPGWMRNLIFKLLGPIAHLRRVGGQACLGWGLNDEKWSRANTEHAVRDWLSPRYAWRHGFNEVTEWFEEDGYRVVDTQSAREYRKLFDRPLSGVGMTGRKRLTPESARGEPGAQPSLGGRPLITRWGSMLRIVGHRSKRPPRTGPSRPHRRGRPPGGRPRRGGRSPRS